MAALSAHEWPGNVREVKNAVERAVILGSGPVLTLADLPSHFKKSASAEGAAETRSRFVLPEDGIVVDEVIRDFLDQALERCGGNKSQAARLLGIHRDQVRYWVKKYGLERWIRVRSKGVARRAEAGDSQG